MVAQQLLLDLPLRHALGREDFMVAESNAAAVALVDQWPRWPSHGAVLQGPPGSGKSHLAQVWRQMSGADVVAAASLAMDMLGQFGSQAALVVEDLGANGFDEIALFHLLNLVRERDGHVLLTTVVPVAALQVKLPDLKSRLAALPVAMIEAPDDQLLRGVLVKLFADHQISVDDGLVSYLLARMPRSLDMARQLVLAIDRAALQERAEVTRAFAGRVLAKLVQTDLTSHLIE